MLSKQALALRLSTASKLALKTPISSSARPLSSLSTSTPSSVSQYGSSNSSAISQHRRRNSFSLSMKLAHTGDSLRHNSSSAPPASSNKKILPTSTRVFEKNSVPKEMSEEDIALDMFFSGYRPLFVLDHFRQNPQRASAEEESQEYLPWDVSVSGLPINPEMKSVPRKIVRNLVPYNLPPTEKEAEEIEAVRQEQMERRIESMKLERQRLLGATGGLLDDDVKVISVEIKSTNGENKVFGDDTEVSLYVDGELSSDPEVLRYLDRFKGVLQGAEEAFSASSVELEETPYITESPASKSYGRIIYATSVKRKRKLKMNKHKLRKRRKLQRAQMRRLKR